MAPADLPMIHSPGAFEPGRMTRDDGQDFAQEEWQI
jgi:hypothetical protein